MGFFSYTCPEHGAFKKMLDRGTRSELCPKCGHESKRIVRAGSVTMTERVDNGLMSKRIDRIQDIDELIDQRNAIHEDEKKEDII